MTPSKPSSPRSVDDIIARLRDGNRRYQSALGDVEDAAPAPFEAQRSSPLAAVICCSDCHVAPEKLFGLEAGQLLVLPTVGGRVSLSEAVAFRCAHERRGVECAVVLGHTGCPTMEAVCRFGMGGGLLTRLVASDVADAREARSADELEAHMVRRMADRLRSMLTESGHLAVLPAMFDTRTGAVEFLAAD